MTQPTEKQIKMMHLVNLMSIAYADGRITEDEHDVLIDIAQDMGLTEDEFNACVEHWKKTDEEDIPFADPGNEDEQIEYLKHFALVMMIDGEINDSERQFMVNVADRFGFNGEEAVPTLIDMVYHEFFSNDEDEDTQDDEEGSDYEEEEEEEGEDPLFEDTDDECQLSLGKMYLTSNIEEAFDELFLPALRNAEAFEAFQIIPGIDTRLFRLSIEQLEKAKEVAQKGYLLGYYVLARYHQVVKPSEDSMETAMNLLKSLSEKGIGDAAWALAMCYLRGYQGPVLLDRYNELIDEAIDKNSPIALKQRLHDMAHGENGRKAEPKKVVNYIENLFNEDEENENKYPYLYAVMGDCYRKFGNKDKADECYEKAIDLGYFEAGADRFESRIEGPDKNHWRDVLDILLDSACDGNDPRAFLVRALESVYKYDNQDTSKHSATAAKIREDLETAVQLGNGDAAYYLGLYHYLGSYGFEKNDREAWTWFEKGQRYESGLAFAGMAQMIADGIKPDSTPDNYLLYCQLSALRRGVKEMLHPVIDAYKAGQLDALAEEVEKTYIPMLTQVADQSGTPAIVIVNPDGKANLYKVEKSEWNKIPTLIGAKRLAPVRVNALDKLGKNAELTDHLVAWIDLDAPRKGLPVNAVASKIYQGIIAGDVVFSLADRLYDPMPFYGFNEAKAVVKALGAELQETITDLRAVKETRPSYADYTKVNPLVNNGYVARIEPDGKAHIVKSSLNVFVLFEEDIYDPVRLQTLYDLGAKLGLKGHFTLWTDNSALKKQLNWNPKITPNPIAAKWFPGPVADNVFVAMEDENYRIMLFDDLEQLKQACLALGITENNILID